MEKLKELVQPGDHALLLSLSREITSCRSKEDIQGIVTNRLSKYFRFNEITICLDNPDGETHMNYVHTLSEETKGHPDFTRGIAIKYYINDGIYNVIQQSREPAVFDMHDLMGRANRPSYVDFFYGLNVRQLIGFDIRVKDRSFGAAFVYVKEKRFFSDEQLKLAQAVCSLIAIAVSNIKAYEKIESQLEEIRHYKSKLEEENLYLQEQIKTTNNSNEIIGGSPVVQKVFQLISQVAPSNSTVLICGETGTGKELVARAIHNASLRREKLMIKVNCTTLPAHLVESELYGHEKGSFTGATERRIGKFELANNSTLFLDEIGELPPELQVKLLRALQEKEIERIGGRAVIKTNVRIIAATNRNLQQEIAAGKFRSDLFYRLNVFPIPLPPLRERKEDIPVLAYHFIQQLSHRTGKKISAVSQGALEQMIRYDWPGNVRELEHLLERSILMTTGNTIREVFIPGQEKTKAIKGDADRVKTMEENERDHIIATLKKSNGRIRGAGGAAELLNVPPTTLHSKMKKLGIRKSGY